MGKIYAALMVRNEEKRVLVTLNSLKHTIDCLCVLDTGSTDNTKDIINSWGKDNDMEYYLWETEWKDFSTCRNFLFEKIEGLNVCKDDWIILMDCNDEWKLNKKDKDGKFLSAEKGDNLKLKEVLRREGLDKDGYSIHQYWYVGWPGAQEQYIPRLFRATAKYRYRRRVHEITNCPYNIKIPEIIDNWLIYQDRTVGCENTGKRWHWDKKILIEDYNDPKEVLEKPRNAYYLAQTYNCLNELENAAFWYKIRTTLGSYGEEIFMAHYKAGVCYDTLSKWEEAEEQYLKAWQHTPRVEPLIRLAQHYRDKSWHQCWGYLKIALDLKIPAETNLDIQTRMWEYERYQLMGIAAFYAGYPEDGKRAIEILVDKGLAGERDIVNLKIYNEVLKTGKL